MSLYPKISSNTSESAFDLPTSITDASPDVYVFTNNNGVQQASLVFIIKNTHGTGSLDIDSISLMQTVAEEGFQLSPTYSTTTDIHIGHETLNVVKTSPSATNTGTTTQVDASGAVGFIGISSSGVANEQGALGIGFNASGSTHCIPIYDHLFIHANPIPALSYAAIVVRFKPTAQILTSNAYLYIVNNVQNYKVYFFPTVYNTVSYAGMLGQATDGGFPGVDSWTSSGNTLNDLGTLDLGLHPIGVDYSTHNPNNVVKFHDYSVTAGQYAYFNGTTTDFSSPNGSLVSTWFNQTSELIDVGFGDVDPGDSLVVPNEDNDVWNLMSGAFLTPDAKSSDEGHCAGDPSFNYHPMLNEGVINEPVYKNFGIDTTNDFYNHSTHYRHTTTNVDTLWTVNSHQSIATTESGVVYKLGKVINYLLPELSDGNQYFAFLVKLGFYYKLSMNQDHINYHKLVATESGPWLQRAINLHERAYGRNEVTGYGFNSLNGNQALGPKLVHGEGALCAMRRDKYYRLQLSLRYNNFNGSTSSDYVIPSFNMQETTTKSLGMYSDWGGGDKYPQNYASGVEIDGSTTVAMSGSITTDANAVWSGWETGTDGVHLALEYYLKYDGFSKDHMYANNTSGSDAYTKVAQGGGEYGENPWGVFYKDWGVAGASWVINRTNLGWGQIGMGYGDQGPRYRVMFHPKGSRLRMKEISNSQMPAMLFWGVSAGDAANVDQYNTSTEYVDWSTPMGVTGKWYYIGTTTERSDWDELDEYDEMDGLSQTYASDFVGARTEEGSWYGHGCACILKPACWQDNQNNPDHQATGRNHTNDIHATSGIAPMIFHVPIAWNKRTHAGGFEKEYAPQQGYFLLPGAQYNQNTTSYKSMGVFKLENTGDYPVWIQNVSVSPYNHMVDVATYSGGGNSYPTRYQPSEQSILLPQANMHMKPDNTNSNDPTWSFCLIGGNSKNDAVATTQFHAGNIEDNVIFTDAQTFISSGQKRYGVQLYNTGGDDLVSRYNEEGAPLIRTNWNDGDHISDNPTSGPSSSEDGQMIAIHFDVNATGNSSYDQGLYWTQVVITYYADSYQNRFDPDYNPANDENSHTALDACSNDNHKTRLHISKYLVGCRVSAPADIFVVDSEDDEIANDSTITFPSMTIE